MRTRAKERPAGQSEESAGEAPNLMRRPSQRRSRNATTSACVGWDFNNIENRPAFRKQAGGPRSKQRCPSKRLHHHQDHDPDHQKRRYFIDNTVEFLATAVAVGGEILNPAGKKTVDTGQ